MASEKKPVQGVVEAVSSNGKLQMKVAGAWYVMSPRVRETVDLPAVGTNVAFDAYGRDLDIFYKYVSVGGSNGYTGSQGSSGAAGVRSVPGGVPAGSDSSTGGPAHSGPHLRSTALSAAATLLAGSDGSLEELMTKTLALAGAFEGYLAKESK